MEVRLTQQRLGVGFIGAGAVAQAIHLPTLARLEDRFEVRHVYDVVPQVAERVAARVGAGWSTSLEDVLADDSVDVVVICSPHDLHAEQVIAACRAGKKGVLCEKPFAVSGEEAARIATVAEETGVPILVGAMHAFDPGWRAASEHWADLPQTVHTIHSSVVLPPNPRFEDFATEVINRPDGGWDGPADVEAQAQMVHGGIMGLAIHDLPLVRSLLRRVDDLEVLEARQLTPVGYHVVFTAGDTLVVFHALMNATWRPSWLLEAMSSDTWLRTEFTPSYVQAGSAVSTLFHADSAKTFGPYDSNGYEAEWRELSEIVRCERPAPALQPLIDDLSFALDVADAAADRVRTAQAEVLA